jgi:hypothetical protein
LWERSPMSYIETFILTLVQLIVANAIRTTDLFEKITSCKSQNSQSLQELKSQDLHQGRDRRNQRRRSWLSGKVPDSCAPRWWPSTCSPEPHQFHSIYTKPLSFPAVLTYSKPPQKSDPTQNRFISLAWAITAPTVAEGEHKRPWVAPKLAWAHHPTLQRIL